MLYQSFYKNLFNRLTGYWIYKSRHLPNGVDLFTDLENNFPNKKYRIVLDIGANDGQSAKILSKRLSNPLIYSFEPDKVVFNQLVINTNKNVNIKPINLGIGNENTVLKLYKGKYSEWNSFVLNLNDNSDYSEIEVIKIDDFLKENDIDKVDLMKIDTEGFDLNVLKGSEIALAEGKIEFIYTECGFYQENKRNTSFWDIVQYLDNFGYILFSTYQIAKSGTYMVNGNALFVKKAK